MSMSQRLNDRTQVERGSIYSSPLVCRCGECGRLIYPPEMCLVYDDWIRLQGWKYTKQSGWVCSRCKPLGRIVIGPNRVFEDEGVVVSSKEPADGE